MSGHAPGAFDDVRKSAKRLGETADKMLRLLERTKSPSDRLRDAAPEMLATLEWIAALKTGGMIEARARAAILKATGGAA